MLTWDDLINKFEIFQKGSEGLERSKLARCMLQLLPSLRQVIEKQFPKAYLSQMMLAVELHLPGISQVVVVQCVAECRFVVRLRNNEYKILQEQVTDLSNVVEGIIEYLEVSIQGDKKDI